MSGPVLVTGAQGYLGGFLVEALRRRGAEVVATGRRPEPGVTLCDLSDPQEAARLLARTRPGLVLHAAAETPQALRDYDAEDAARGSLRALENLLPSLEAPLIYVSSMTVYGPQERVLRHEEDAGAPETAYARGKWRGEALARAAGASGFAARIPGLFGGGRRGGLVWNLAQALREGRAPDLPDRPILWAAAHVEHVAESLAALAGVLAASPSADWRPVNLGYAEVHSVNRLAAEAGYVFGGEALCGLSHPEFQFDLTRARALGVSPQGDLHEALERVKAEFAAEAAP